MHTKQSNAYEMYTNRKERLGDFTWRVSDCEELVGVTWRLSDCEELSGSYLEEIVWIN